MESSVDLTLAVLAVGVLVLATVVIGAASDRIRLPSLAGFILLGGALRFLDEQAGVLGEPAWTVLEFLGQLGIIVLLFRIGFESDVSGLTGQLRAASLTWVSDVAVAGIAGFVFVYVVLGMDLAPSLVAATAFTATSVGIPVAIWKRHDKLDSAEGQRLLDIAELDDISAILIMAALFAMLPSLRAGALETATLIETVGWLALKLGLFAAALYLFARYAEAPFAAVLHRLHSSIGPMLALLGVGLVIAAVADMLGFSVAIGAFLAGLAFSRDPDRTRVDRAMRPVHDLVAPFFFVFIGASIPVNQIGGAIGAGLLLAVVAALSKLLGDGVPSVRDLGAPVALVIGVSMIPRAEITMVVTQHARSLGTWAMPDELFSAMVIVVLLTSLVAPLVLDRWLLPRLPVRPEARSSVARTGG